MRSIERRIPVLDDAEPEVLIETDGVRVGSVRPEVHAADATVAKLAEQPFDEGSPQAPPTRPLQQVDVEMRGVGLGQLGRSDLRSVDETHELRIGRAVRQSGRPVSANPPGRLNFPHCLRPSSWPYLGYGLRATPRP